MTSKKKESINYFLFLYISFHNKLFLKEIKKIIKNVDDKSIVSKKKYIQYTLVFKIEKKRVYHRVIVSFTRKLMLAEISYPYYWFRSLY